MNPYPQCENCDFFKHEEQSARKCAKHNFVMPALDWQVVCKDWQHARQGVDFDQFEPKTLYYYSYGLGDVIFSVFQRFEALKKPYLTVILRQDEEFGWVIYPRNRNIFFPAPNAYIAVQIGESRRKFQVVKAERRIAYEPMPKGVDMTIIDHAREFLMLKSIESPTLIYDWLNQFLDLPRLLSDHAMPSLLAFLEVTEAGQEYVLYADMLMYGKYAR